MLFRGPCRRTGHEHLQISFPVICFHRIDQYDDTFFDYGEFLASEAFVCYIRLIMAPNHEFYVDVNKPESQELIRQWQNAQFFRNPPRIFGISISVMDKIVYGIMSVGILFTGDGQIELPVKLIGNKNHPLWQSWMVTENLKVVGTDTDEYEMFSRIGLNFLTTYSRCNTTSFSSNFRDRYSALVINRSLSFIEEHQEWRELKPYDCKSEPLVRSAIGLGKVMTEDLPNFRSITPISNEELLKHI
jgi:hypothetical protein